MTTANELRAGLTAVAKRSVGIMTACSNVESAKLYLVLPFLSLLGYDCANPYEVYPEHTSDADPANAARIDFAVLRDGAPVIAVACRRPGADLAAGRESLRRYFDAVRSTKLGVVTNGVIYEFFVDSDQPEVMDDEPFLTLDLETTARAGVSDEVVETLASATKINFDPDTIAEAAHIRLISKRLRAFFIEEAKSPSNGLCRFALDRVGIAGISDLAIERHYAAIVKQAFEESLILPVAEKLRSSGAADSRSATLPLLQLGPRMETAQRESAILAYVRRRLAFLAEDEHQFAAVDAVHGKSYVGRLVVYYDRERKGRLFEYVAGQDGADKFIFPEPIGEIVTDTLTDIDAALKALFTARLREFGPGHHAHAPARRAEGR